MDRKAWRMTVAKDSIGMCWRRWLDAKLLSCTAK